MTGVLDDLQEECHSFILHDNVKISCLIVHSQQVGESRSKRKIRDSKGARSFDSGSSKERIDIQYKPRFKKRVSNKVISKFLMYRYDRVSNPKPKKGNNTSSPNEKPTCGKCGKKHYRYCLNGSYNCFGCGKRRHKLRDFPM